MISDGKRRMKKPTVIGEKELDRYLKENSDFSFEMRITNLLFEQGYEVEHSGTYEDPVTNKTREFDIRAIKDIVLANKITVHVSLAVECKNLSHFLPLVLHSVQRKKNEAFNCIVYQPSDKKFRENEKNTQEFIRYNLPNAPSEDRCRVIEITSNNKHHYKTDEWVAKSMDLVGISDQNKIKSGDSQVFEKMSQAINSSFGLIEDIAYNTADDREHFYAVLPILVVPDGRLWNILYTKSGEIYQNPRPAEHVPYFLNKPWSAGGKYNQIIYTISHLETCTQSGLINLLKKYFDLPNEHNSIFGDLDVLLSDAHKLLNNSE